mgnify:CR=1 FL=1
MLDLNHIVPLIVLTRDRDGGSIYCGDDGLPRIDYSVSKHDHVSLTEGIDRSLRILVAAGAKAVWTSQRGLEEFKVNPELGQNDPAFEKFIKQMKSIGFGPGIAQVGSAHQMGTW